MDEDQEQPKSFDEHISILMDIVGDFGDCDDSTDIAEAIEAWQTMKAQRDELAAALRDLVETAVQWTDESHRNVKQARAALAKIEAQR